MKFFNHLKDAIQYNQLPKELRRLTFYSEGKNYWPYLEGLVKELIEKGNIPICYISSGEDDPGLELKHPNYRAFKTDEGFIRNWLFENIDTDVMVMTMPDLHQYQLKRSKHDVHYIYVQHSLVSLHMVYRKGAFDHFDTIFCAGPHHVEEIRAMEKIYNLPSKHLIEQGYSKLDDIIKTAESKSTGQGRQDGSKHYLVAPSWGPHGTIESGVGAKIIDQLMEQGHKVTLRPHPQTIRFAKRQVEDILKRHQSSPRFNFESNVAGQDSLHDSDVMISDWSGAALEYAFGLGKPVIFVDVPRKINNVDYKELSIEPFEVSIRERIGSVVDPEDEVSFTSLTLPQTPISSSTSVYNLKRSAEVGSDYIRRLLDKKKS